MRGKAPRERSVFAGGGEMAARMAAFDWAATPLGAPDGWPESMRTLVRVMLGSKQPMFLTWGPERSILYNDGYVELLGRKHPAALGQPFLEVWKEAAEDLLPLVDQVEAGESVHMDDITLFLDRRGSPEEAHFAFSYTPVRDELGRIAGMFCPCQENTRQVFAERRTVAESERLRQLFHQAPSFMAMLRGPDHVFEFANRAYLQLVGHRDVVGLPVCEALPEIAGQGFFDLLDRVYATGEAFWGRALKVAVQRTSGAAPEERFVDLVYQPVTDPDGTVTGIFAEGYDVTDTIWAQEALRESEEHFRFAAELNPQVAWTAAPDGQLDRVAERWRDWTGTSGLGESWGLGLHPDDLGRTVEAWTRSVRTGEPYDIEHRVTMRSGDHRWARSRAFPRRAADGSIVKWYGATEDIHGRKLAEAATGAAHARAEAAAAEREAVLAQLAEGVIATDAAGRITIVNEAAAAIHGVAELAVEPGRYSDTYGLFTEDGQPYPPDELPLARAVRGETVSDARWRIRRPDGIEVLAIGSAHPVRDGDGRQTGALLTLRDDTAREAAERALREREAQLRLATEAAEIGFWDVDLLTDTLHWPPRVKAMFGISPEVPVSMADFYAGLHPDDREGVGAAYAASLDPVERALYDVEYRTVGKEDGAVRWVAAKGRGLFDAAGKCVRVVGAALDITGRKRTEERLRETEERYRLAARATNDAIWDWHFASNHVLWNEALAEAYGHPPERVEPTGEWWIAQIHPDDRARVDASIHAAVDGGDERWSDEYRFRRADGSYADVLDRGHIIRDGGGRAVRMIGAMLDLTVRREGERRLRDSEARFQGMVNSIDQMIWSTLPDGYHDYYNQRWYDYTGVPEGSTDGEAWNGMFHPDDQEHAWSVWRRSLETGEPYHIEYRLRHRSGAYRWVLGRAQAVRDKDGRITRWFGTCTDIQDIVDAREVLARSRAELEEQVGERTAALVEAHEQLRQSQKMEAVGQLTGGIAHDFNNLLAGIVGSLELMQTRIAQGRVDGVERYAKAAMSSAQRAAALTHRLLAFSRRQPLDPKPVNANALIAGMEDLLRRTIGPAHALEFVTAGGLWTTLCDPNQLESAILNLAINARDAMPEGGRLTVETANARLDDAYAAASRDVAPGQYVAICVTDTGTGMSPEVVARAFEPFFTTKPLGQGTGLGLSMVYGFAKQSEGHLKIYSEEGQGTTVKIYLPRHHGPAAEDAAEPAGAAAPPARSESGETVLVVEDEPVIRALIVDVLEDLGYRAIEAPDGPAGLKILQSPERIDLVVSDVGLPGLNGRQLADHARGLRPGLPILFVTGYAENATLANGFLDPGMEMITKPFAVDALAAKIRAILRGR